MGEVGGRCRRKGMRRDRMGGVGSLLFAGGQTRGPELRLDRGKVAALTQGTPRSAPASQGLQEVSRALILELHPLGLGVACRVIRMVGDGGRNQEPECVGRGSS